MQRNIYQRFATLFVQRVEELSVGPGINDSNIGLLRNRAAIDTEEEAVSLANASEYGLVAYLHTRDDRRIERYVGALNYGMIAVIRTKITGAQIPFGGNKQSGRGREGSRFGIEAFTHIKYVCKSI